MKIPRPIENLFHLSLDTLYSLIPRPKVNLKDCKIIAHRGAHDNKVILENTIEAFDKAAELGLFGIEFDVRWTKDNIPIIYHDPCLKRLYGQEVVINQTLFSELRNSFPAIPSLEEVILRYRGKLHFMIEIKEAKSNSLKEILCSLAPIKDYHILSLKKDNFRVLNSLEPSCFLPVAELNVDEWVPLVVENQWAGLLGHYFLMNSKYLNLLKGKNKIVGTGFIGSRNCLYREFGRGVDFIFTNTAEKLMEIVKR